MSIDKHFKEEIKSQTLILLKGSHSNLAKIMLQYFYALDDTQTSNFVLELWKSYFIDRKLCIFRENIDKKLLFPSHGS